MLHMFLKNVWQNMKKVFQYIIWSHLIAILHLCDKASSSFCKRRSILSIIKDTNTTVNVKGDPILHLLPSLSNWNDSYVEVTHNFEDAVLVKDQCNPKRMAYAVHSGYLLGKVVVTHDGFHKNAVTLHIKNNLFTNEPVLSSMVFDEDGKLLTVINNELVLINIYTLEHNITHQGVGLHDHLDTVTLQACCSAEVDWCHSLFQVVLFYKYNTQTRRFYYSVDGGVTFTRHTLMSDKQQFKVHSATVMGSDLVAVFLAQNVATQEIMLLAYPLNEHRHFHLTRRGDSTYSRVLHMDSSNSYMMIYQLYSGFSSFLLWDSNHIYYMAGFSGEYHDITVHHTEGPSILNTSEYIRHIDSNVAGEFLMTTSHNRLLYGRESIMTQASFLSNITESISTEVIALLDTDSDVILISPEVTGSEGEDGSVIYSSHHYLSDYLTQLQINMCPYQNVERIGFQSYFHLDIQDSLEFSTIMHVTAWYAVSLLAEVSIGESMVLNNTLQTSVSEDPGIVSVIMTTHGTLSTVSYQEHNFAEHQNLMKITKGVGLRVATTSTSLLCTDHSQAVAQISFGCAKDKHLVAHRAERSCMDIVQDYEYILEPDHYDPTFGKDGPKIASGPKTVSYDYQLYGCTNRTYYNEPFRFDLRLYKGSTYIGPMTGEYVVLEINGVNQFSYDLTVQRSGCEYPPQSWREMLLKADSSTPADQVWHRGNYRNCMVKYDLPTTRNFTLKPKDPYEIMSVDNGNYLTFDRNGIFLFEIIVVDHDYSFCNLRTRLAVEVYGVQPEVPISFFLIMCVTIGGILVIMTFIFCVIDIRRRRNLAREQDMDDLEEFDAMVTEYEEMEATKKNPNRVSIGNKKRRGSGSRPRRPGSSRGSNNNRKYSNG